MDKLARLKAWQAEQEEAVRSRVELADLRRAERMLTDLEKIRLSARSGPVWEEALDWIWALIPEWHTHPEGEDIFSDVVSGCTAAEVYERGRAVRAQIDRVKAEQASIMADQQAAEPEAPAPEPADAAEEPQEAAGGPNAPEEAQEATEPENGPQEAAEPPVPPVAERMEVGAGATLIRRPRARLTGEDPKVPPHRRARVAPRSGYKGA